MAFVITKKAPVYMVSPMFRNGHIKTLYSFTCDRKLGTRTHLNSIDQTCVLSRMNRKVQRTPCFHFSVNKRNNFSDEIKPPKPEDPLKKTWRLLKNDMQSLKKFEFGKRKTTETSVGPDGIPTHCDILVIGGGIMGSSIAYWLKQRVPEGFTLCVVERDPQYLRSSTTLSVGGLRQQFSLPENIQMSLFGAHFLRNVKRYLTVQDSDPPEIDFNPHGYMFLASEAGAEQLEKNYLLQTELGAKVELLSPEGVKMKFPWISTENVALACYGLENEGWFDPWALLDAFKKKAISLGTIYSKAEAVGFEFRDMDDMVVQGVKPGQYVGLDKLLVRTESGEIRSIKFAIAIIACGAFSSEVARMARIGTGKGMLSVPLPVEPRKRYVYCFHCPDGPGLDTPLLIDSTGTYFRREGLGGNYICGKSPIPSEEPGIDNLEVDYNFFDQQVWPDLAHRIPLFENIKLETEKNKKRVTDMIKSAWAGYYDYNYFDQNCIVGPHPHYFNLYMATGFSGHGIQQAPAVGRAVMEMILDGSFQSVDLTRFGFERILQDNPLFEKNIV